MPNQLRKWDEMSYRERLEAFANNETEARHMVPTKSERARLMVDATGFLALGELMAEALGRAQSRKPQVGKKE